MVKWDIHSGLRPITEKIEATLNKNGWRDYILGVLLFGSGRENNKKTLADIDLFFILQNNERGQLPYPMDNNLHFRNSFLKYDFAKQLHIFSLARDEFLNLCRLNNTFINNVLLMSKIVRGTGKDGNLFPFLRFQKKAFYYFNLIKENNKEKYHQMKKNNLLVKPKQFTGIGRTMNNEQ